VNKRINEALKKDGKKEDGVISLLLLGAGESGKTTILKQFKILHLNGFTEDELDNFRTDIRVNILQSISSLVSNALPSSIRPELQEYAREISEINEYKTQLTPELARVVANLWKDKAVKESYNKRADVQIQSNASFLLDSVERIASADYIPTETDILCCRVRTTGVVEVKFVVENVMFKIMDVGGQRSERKKWINFFDGISALMYVVALDEYDLKLFEDETANRMLESLRLWEEMCNAAVFAKTPTILFLNKKDLLKEKLLKVNLSNYFPEYKGGSDYKQACAFIKHKFVSLNRGQKKHIYSSNLRYLYKKYTTSV